MVKPLTCQPCPLYERSNGFSKPDGTGALGVTIIGEALGHEEYLDGLPFRPKAVAGSMLMEALRIVSEELRQPISREGFRYWNVIACNPPYNKLEGESYAREAIECCDQYFRMVVKDGREIYSGNSTTNDVCSLPIFNRSVMQEGNGHIRNSKAQVILALGNTALRKVTGVSGDVKKKESITNLRGFVLNGLYGQVVSSLHPAFIKRGMEKLTPLLVHDIKRALQVANGSFTHFPSHSSYKNPLYNIAPSVDDAMDYAKHVQENNTKVVSFDIETTSTVTVEEDERDFGNEEIQQIQFYVSDIGGIAIPFTTDYAVAIRRVLSSGNPKCGHNCWNFDVPRLRDRSFNIEGRIDDTMWMFKHLHPGLPRGLQNAASLFGFPFPWKHLFGSNLPLYGCADVDATAVLFEEVSKQLRELDLWKGYDRHIHDVYHVVLQPASERGIPVDEGKRIKLQGELVEQREILDGKLQELIPDEIKNVKTWKKGPNYLKKAFETYGRITEYLNGRGEVGVDFQSFMRRRYGLRYHEEGGYKWSEVLDFAASSQQLIRYLRWKQEECRTSEDKEVRKLVKAYEVPLTLKTKRETTNKDELEFILEKTNDPVIEAVMEIRSLDTNINNYIPNWKPHPNTQCVHCEWSFSPPQGQTATRTPNIQNCSKHTKLGQMFRRIIEAPRGYSFVEFDKRRFHVATMGYIANDPNYIRFAQMDSHSIFTSYIVDTLLPISLSMGDKEILERVKEVKEWNKWNFQRTGVDIRQEQAKPSVLGNQLGLGAKKLQWQNRRSIKAVYIKDERRLGVRLSAERMQNILAELFPKVHRVKEVIKQMAYRNRQLVVREWGYRQEFFNVYEKRFSKTSGQWEMRYGADQEKCLALMVQGMAFGEMKYSWLRMAELGLLEKYNFVNTIHDSNVFLCSNIMIDECIKDVSAIMNAPCPILLNDSTRSTGGLVVKVDIKIGSNWADYDLQNNPGGMKEYEKYHR